MGTQFHSSWTCGFRGRTELLRPSFRHPFPQSDLQIARHHWHFSIAAMQESDKTHVKYLAGGLSCMASSFRASFLILYFSVFVDWSWANFRQFFVHATVLNPMDTVKVRMQTEVRIKHGSFFLFDFPGRF